MDTIQTPFTVLGEFKAQARISSIEISPDGGQTWFNCDVDEKTANGRSICQHLQDQVASTT